MRRGADVRPDHHHRRVPPDEGPDAPLEVLDAGELGLGVGGDRIHIGGRDRRREVDLRPAGLFEEPHQEVAGAGPAVDPDDGVEGGEPLFGLVRIDVGELVGQSVESITPILAPATARTHRRPAPRAWRQGGARGARGVSPDVALRGGPRPRAGAGCWADARYSLSAAGPRRSSTPTAPVSGTPGPGGWAWADDRGLSGSGREPDTTNQRMEVLAVIRALAAHPGRSTGSATRPMSSTASASGGTRAGSATGGRTPRGSPSPTGTCGRTCSPWHIDPGRGRSPSSG